MFIVIDGIDGCGKSTQVSLLASYLEAKIFKFPNKDTDSGKLIYDHLFGRWSAKTIDGCQLSVDHDALNPTVFQALQTLNRLEHIDSINSVIKTGQHLVVDRYWTSAYAYGKADGVKMDLKTMIEPRLMPSPDMFILLDVDVEDSKSRRATRRDRYEDNIPFLKAVAQNYRDLWAMAGIEFDIIDARGTKEETHHKLVKLMNQYGY